jgi:hypothetical protein
VTTTDDQDVRLCGHCDSPESWRACDV